MLSRRDLLMNLAGGAAGIAIIDSGASIRSINESAQNQSPSNCSGPLNGPNARYFPNVVVYTHDGRRALFYDDLLRGKMAMINFMSIKNDSIFPVTSNLAKVQRLLKERVGRDLFMYSITVDPEHDTPQALRVFAQKHQVGAGWTFLTGERGAIEVLRSRLFVASGGSVHDHHGTDEDCSMALIRYGNEAIGIWGAVPGKTDPESIAARLAWVEPGPPAKETPARGGPMPSSVPYFPPRRK